MASATSRTGQPVFPDGKLPEQYLPFFEWAEKLRALNQNLAKTIASLPNGSAADSREFSVKNHTRIFSELGTVLQKLDEELEQKMNGIGADCLRKEDQSYGIPVSVGIFSGAAVKTAFKLKASGVAASTGLKLKASSAAALKLKTAMAAPATIGLGPALGCVGLGIGAVLLWQYCHPSPTEAEWKKLQKDLEAQIAYLKAQIKQLEESSSRLVLQVAILKKEADQRDKKIAELSEVVASTATQIPELIEQHEQELKQEKEKVAQLADQLQKHIKLLEAINGRAN